MNRMVTDEEGYACIGSTNKGLEMVTSKETKKMDKCREEIQTHTNRNDLTRELLIRHKGFKSWNRLTC